MTKGLIIGPLLVVWPEGPQKNLLNFLKVNILKLILSLLQEVWLYF
jgi:hypothetical protein